MQLWRVENILFELISAIACGVIYKGNDPALREAAFKGVASLNNVLVLSISAFSLSDLGLGSASKSLCDGGMKLLVHLTGHWQQQSVIANGFSASLKTKKDRRSRQF